jgi:serine/threonine-protein kinase
VDRVGAVLVETYRISRLIAEGGMGDVYEAQHVRIPKKYAVKFLKSILVDKTEATARFRREAEIIATLDHPNIVTLFDYNIGEDKVPYIVLEYLDGEHLGRMIDQGPMPLDDVIRVLESVGKALEAAHKLDVVHRDLKPENIILCANGTIKVVDFGVAKLRGAAGLTAFNTTVGTVPYMSPEQILGGTLDGRTDEFALAAITYEMLTGETCFGTTGPVPDQAMRVLRHVPPPIANVPESVNKVIQKALAKEAGDRFPTATAFVEAMKVAAEDAEMTPPSLADDVVSKTEENAVLPLSPVQTAVVPTLAPSSEKRADMKTPKSDIDFVLPVAGKPRVTAQSLRAVERTNKFRLLSLRYDTRTLSIIAGAAFGIVLAVTIWLLVR